MATGELDDRVAVVTGAGSGIGRASAMRFAAAGARVLVNDIDAVATQATVDEILAAGGVAHAHAADVGDSAAVDAMIAAAVDSYGRLDVVHNNAGYGLPGRVADITDDMFAEVLRVNLCGVLYGTRAALRFMVEQRSGSIVNTASNAGFGAARDRAGYGAAKAAVINLTRSTAVENGRYGVRANAICPGPIETPAFLRFAPDIDYYRAQIPLGRLGAPEDVAELALFLASDRSSYLTGTAISLDGGLMAQLPAPFLTPEQIVDG
jgi:NAD(P)-dependent dehydrogenase (short-subunit alcohol dehydrogenase family)